MAVDVETSVAPRTGGLTGEAVVTENVQCP